MGPVRSNAPRFVSLVGHYSLDYYPERALLFSDILFVRPILKMFRMWDVRFGVVEAES